MGVISDLLFVVSHLFVLFAFVNVPIASAQSIFNVKRYGALSDGKTDSIQVD